MAIRFSKNIGRVMMKKKKLGRRREIVSPMDIKNAIGYIVDDDQHAINVYTSDMLINQLKRDSKIIASSFDKLCHNEMLAMSTLISRSLMIQDQQHSIAENLVNTTIISLLKNASSSFSASVILVRTGYRSQPGIIIRNIIETLSMALYLFSNRQELENFTAGKIKSSKTISFVKAMIPPFGFLYGYFSNEFTHASTNYGKPQPIAVYTKDDEDLILNLFFLKIASWLIYVVTELICLDIVDERRYWKYTGLNEDGKQIFSFSPSEEARLWDEKYFDLSRITAILSRLDNEAKIK